MRTSLRAALLATGIMLASTASVASASEDKSWTLDAGATVVSDYRFRGLSLTDKDPAFQPELTLTHKSGVYVGFWGSTLADNGGEDIETDVMIGYSRELGPVSADVNAMWYLYPGASQDNYLELTGRLSASVGPAEVGATFSYAPPQNHIGDISNRYYMVDASVPLPSTPLTLSGSFGIEDGAFGDRKQDWSLGVCAEISHFTLGVAYVDSARNGGDPLGKATAVVSLSAQF
jgi:uncharacterized protein (TIGR02001 family)